MPMPVLPLVGSISVSPGLMRPSFSASAPCPADAILERAARVQELALGPAVHGRSAPTRWSRTSGVRPITSRIESKRMLSLSGTEPGWASQHGVADQGVDAFGEGVGIGPAVEPGVPIADRPHDPAGVILSGRPEEEGCVCHQSGCARLRAGHRSCSRAGPAAPSLLPPGEPGTPLYVEGRILGPAGPVAGAAMYVYQTDAHGIYSSEVNDDNTKPRLKARFQTGPDGASPSATIMPGSIRARGRRPTSTSR